MKWFAVMSAIALAAQLAGQEKTSADRLVAGGSSVGRPPVLRDVEPNDNLVVTLPGAPVPLPPIAPAPVPTPAPAAPSAVPQDDEDDHRPVLRRAPRPVFPAEFERDSAAFCQKMIAAWTQPDAYNLLGEPLRERVALDDSDAENGRIYAFSDPTGRYREIELDFARDTGLLRSVFVYPWKMTWTECRKLWGTQVQSTPANKGRIFHSYLNRRLDVLVDQTGKVISFGLY
jgi:hypothetical protein